MALIQVGVAALRSPNGEFLPSVPIYREIEMPQKAEKECEYIPLDDLANIFADKFKKYKSNQKSSKSF